MQIIADLQLHSKYARAVSQYMELPHIWEWCRRKGIDLIATGDWTHPLWMNEIKQNLEETGGGLYKLKTHPPACGSKVKPTGQSSKVSEGPYFLLSGEVSCIYSQGGKGRRVHLLIFAPSIAAAEKINKELTRRGCNLLSDGRPIIGISSIEFTDICLSIDSSCLVIPAHAWTPWFGMYGSESGFDSISECFGKFTEDIYAVETGLSSDPAMNWRIKELDNRSIVSFSDAHSGPKLGREATVFELSELSYTAIREAVRGQGLGISTQKSKLTPDPSILIPNTIAYTIEFYPEEGKYHFSGHRNCNIKQDPSQTKDLGTLCPVCGKKMTIGVMHRVAQLAGRTEESLKLFQKKVGETQIKGTYSETFSNRPPYIKMVPLQEIIAESFNNAANSQKVQTEYNRITDHFNGEFNILLKTSLSDIVKTAGERIGNAVDKVRRGDIVVDPGYDGVFGVVKIWKEDEIKKEEAGKEQMSLF